MSNTKASTQTTGADICSLLDELFPWLNANLRINPAKPLTPQDVAHISLIPREFEQIPGEAQWCPHKRLSFKRAHDMEFWLSIFPLPAIRECADLRGRTAWKLTGNTAALFNR